MKLSKNGAGIATMIVSLAAMLGLNVDIDTVKEAVAALGTLVSIGLMIWNQKTRPDVKGFIFKR